MRNGTFKEENSKYIKVLISFIRFASTDLSKQLSFKALTIAAASVPKITRLIPRAVAACSRPFKQAVASTYWT